MKVLAVLSMIGLAAIMGATDAAASDRTARLTDPASPDPSLHDVTRVPREMRLDGAVDGGLSAQIGLSEIERNGIRDAIRGQILALAARDADKAFSFLAPAAQSYYAEPSAFLSTLTTQLKPLAGTTGYAFSGLEREATDAIQHVVLADAQGLEWHAKFTLERQPDGHWGIKHCLVEPAVGDRI